MVAKGKRKAQEGPASPARKTTKRKAADADANADADAKAFQSGTDGEEDVGRGRSEDLMRVIRVIHPKDEAWTKNIISSITTHEAELNAAVDEKELELNTLDNNFQTDMRLLLTDVLGVPSSRPSPYGHHKPKTGESDAHLDPRPGFDHAQLLFAKSERLLQSFAMASEAIRNAATHTDQLIRFDKDKEDVARLLHLGQEISRRKIQDVLKRPEEDAPRKKKKSAEAFDEDKLHEAAAIFNALKKKEDQESDEEEVEDYNVTDVAVGSGLYPILHDAKKGLKRLAGDIIIDID